MEAASLLLIFAYLFPTLVAVSRSHHNSSAIFVLNLLLGWTLLGWIVALVWAFTVSQKPARA
jgi:uncharacterized membrane protein YqaE (UPF0057 family)